MKAIGKDPVKEVKRLSAGIITFPLRARDDLWPTYKKTKANRAMRVRGLRLWIRTRTLEHEKKDKSE